MVIKSKCLEEIYFLCYVLPEMGYRPTIQIDKTKHFKTVPDPFNGQTVNFFLKTPKIDGLGIERIWNTIEVMGYIILQNCSTTVVMLESCNEFIQNHNITQHKAIERPS